MSEKHHEHEEGCTCGCESEYNKKEIIIEFLFIDLIACKRTIETKKVLFKVVDKLKSELEPLGYTFKIEGYKMNTEQIKAEFEFKSSPTILVNYQDILGKIQESICTECSKTNDKETKCRSFEYKNIKYDIPPEQMVYEGIIKEIL